MVLAGCCAEPAFDVHVTFCQTLAGEVLERARNKLGH